MAALSVGSTGQVRVMVSVKVERVRQVSMTLVACATVLRGSFLVLNLLLGGTKGFGPVEFIVPQGISTTSLPAVSWHYRDFGLNPGCAASVVMNQRIIEIYLFFLL